MASSTDCHTVRVGAQGTGLHRKLRQLPRPPPTTEAYQRHGLILVIIGNQVCLWEEAWPEKGYADPPLKRTFIRPHDINPSRKGCYANVYLKLNLKVVQERVGKPWLAPASTLAASKSC